MRLSSCRQPFLFGKKLLVVCKNKAVYLSCGKVGRLLDLFIQNGVALYDFVRPNILFGGHVLANGENRIYIFLN